ncbi:MAG: hypothetical protein LUD27_00720 [Clostridia bacterium]|nr:hypothetical protein [Clostridia bacterium]
MKNFYKKNNECLAELKDILMNSENVDVVEQRSFMSDEHGKQFCGRVVIIDGKRTFFTQKLLDFLIEKNILIKD